VRVRITVRPREPELDGVSLDRFVVGTVREVSPTIGAWLITQGYAEPEMRSDAAEQLDFSSPVKPGRDRADDRKCPRRRSTDR
jgi:hypothetical protein